jgi:hypothetical protein
VLVSRWQALGSGLVFGRIAVVRGRTRGAGNELALACDLRYASREKAIFGRPEVGIGIVPGGGGAERLPRSIGRDRQALATAKAMVGRATLGLDVEYQLGEYLGQVNQSL